MPNLIHLRKPKRKPSITPIHIHNLRYKHNLICNRIYRRLLILRLNKISL